MIDRGGAPAAVMSVEFITWAHREFCERLPDDLLWVENPSAKKRIQAVPGELRKDYVVVGRHVPPAPDQRPSCKVDRGLCLAASVNGESDNLRQD